MDVAELGYKVDSSGLVTATTRLDQNTAAAGRVQRATERMQRGWDRIRPALRALAVGAAAAGTAMAAMVANTIRGVEQVALMASQIGTTTEALTGMRYAAQQMARVSEGQFDMAMRRMTRRITEAAAGGGPAANAIKAMGLSAQELAKQAPDEQFRRIADAIKGTSDQGTRLQHVMALMDTEGMPLVNMLAEGADGIREFTDEAREMGLVITQETATKAREFGRQMDRLKGQMRGVWLEVATELMPHLFKLSDLIQSPGFQDGFRSIAQGAVTAAGAFATFATNVANLTKRLAENWAARKHGALLDDVPRMHAEVERIEERISRIQRWQERGRVMQAVTGLGRADPYAISRDRALGAPGVGGSAREKAERELNILLERRLQLRRAINEVMNAEPDPVADAVIDPVTLNLPTIITDVADATDDLARAQAEAAKWAQEFTRAQDNARAMIEDWRAELEGPAAQVMLQHNRMEEELGLLMAENVITFTEYAEAMELVHQMRKAALAGLAEDVEEVTDTMSQYSIQAARNMQSHFADFLFDPFEGGLRGMAESFSRTLRRMAAEMAASEIFKALGNSMSGMGGFWGAIGGVLAKQGGRRASGGPVRAGGTYLVGEQGPELLQMGHGTGHVVPNHALMRGGGAPQVNINLHGAPEGTTATARENDMGGFDVDVMIGRIEGGIAGRLAQGTGSLLPAIKGRLDVRERV